LEILRAEDWTMRLVAVMVCGASLLAAGAAAQVKDGVKPYVKEDGPVLVLNHVRVIDGTGAAPLEDQRIDIESGKITRVQSAKLRNAYPPNAKVLDLTYFSVLTRLSTVGGFDPEATHAL